MRGSISRRGERSWRIRFDLERIGGKRKVHASTVKGTRKDAEAELARLLHEANSGVRVDPVKMTVAEWLRQWLDGRTPDLADMSVERYGDIIERQAIPVIGHIVLQKLKPVHIRNWMTDMRIGGGRYGRPLSARTVGHAYRCVSAAMQAAVDIELLSRNPCAPVSPPAAEAEEVCIIKLRGLYEALKGDRIFPIVKLALATGMRRGELLALRWSAVDLDHGEVRVEQQLIETKAGGLQFTKTKNKLSRRIPIGAKTIAMLREHRVAQLELRMQLGAGKPPADHLVFADHEDQPIGPNYLSKLWRRATVGVVDTTFHALRHTYASALIKSGVDVVTVSRRLGHHSPAFTLRVYAHLFDQQDAKDAEVVERLL